MVHTIERMNDRRFKFGTTITIVWLMVMGWVVLGSPTAAIAMKPNEWGDFFAGFFAPLAFLWLVLGYMQQGQELQLSTQALLLQAEELKNSVQQQRELVEVTRSQVESDRDALQLERLARREAAQPRFVITNHGANFHGDGNTTFTIAVQNAGNTATEVVGSLESSNVETSTIFKLAMFARATQFQTEIKLVGALPSSGSTLRVSYLDADRMPGSVAFHVFQTSQSPQSFLGFSQIVS